MSPSSGGEEKVRGKKTDVEPSEKTRSGVRNYFPFNLKMGTDPVAEKKWLCSP